MASSHKKKKPHTVAGLLGFHRYVCYGMVIMESMMAELRVQKLPDDVAIDILRDIFILYGDTVNLAGSKNYDIPDVDSINSAQQSMEESKAVTYDESNPQEVIKKNFGIETPEGVLTGEVGEQIIATLDDLWKKNPDSVHILQRAIQNFINSAVEGGRSLSPDDIAASLEGLDDPQTNISTVAAVEYSLNERYKKRPGSPESQKNEKALARSKDMKNIADSIDIQRLKESNPALFQTVQSQKKAILSGVPVNMTWAGDSGLTRDDFATILLIRKNPSLMQEDIFATDNAKKDYDVYMENLTDEQFAALVDEHVGPDVVAILQNDTDTGVDAAAATQKTTTVSKSIAEADLTKPSSTKKIAEETIPQGVGSNVVDDIKGATGEVQKIMNSGDLLFASDAQEIPKTYDPVAGEALLKSYNMQDIGEEQQKALLTGVMLSQRYDRNLSEQPTPEHQKIIESSQNMIQKHIMDYAQEIAINGTKEAYVGGVTGTLSGPATEGLSFDIQDMQYDDASGVFGVSVGDISVQFGSDIKIATYLHKKSDNSNDAPGEVRMKQIPGSSGLPTLQNMMHDMDISGLLSGSVSIADYKQDIQQKTNTFAQKMRSTMQGQSGALQDSIANERVKHEAKNFIQSYKETQQGSGDVIMRDQDHQKLAGIMLPTLKNAPTIATKMQLMDDVSYWGEKAKNLKNPNQNLLKKADDPWIQGFVSGGGAMDFLENFLITGNGKSRIDTVAFAAFTDFAEKVSTGEIESGMLFVEYAEKNGVVLKPSTMKKLEEGERDTTKKKLKKIEDENFK